MQPYYHLAAMADDCYSKGFCALHKHFLYPHQLCISRQTLRGKTHQSGKVMKPVLWILIHQLSRIMSRKLDTKFPNIRYM